MQGICGSVWWVQQEVSAIRLDTRPSNRKLQHQPRLISGWLQYQRGVGGGYTGYSIKLTSKSVLLGLDRVQSVKFVCNNPVLLMKKF